MTPTLTTDELSESNRIEPKAIMFFYAPLIIDATATQRPYHWIAVKFLIDAVKLVVYS